MCLLVTKYVAFDLYILNKSWNNEMKKLDIIIYSYMMNIVDALYTVVLDLDIDINYDMHFY